MKSFFNFKARKKRSKFQALLLSVLIFAGMFYAMADTAPEEKLYSQQLNEELKTTGNIVELGINPTLRVNATWSEENLTWTIAPEPSTEKIVLSKENFRNIIIKKYWKDAKEKLKDQSRYMTVKFQENLVLEENIEGMFSEIENLKLEGLENLDTSKVENMKKLFYNSKLVSGFNLPNWVTSKVVSMGGMFSNASIENANLDFSKWDMSSVESSASSSFPDAEGINGLFEQATIKNTDINFYGVSLPNVAKCERIFYGAKISSDATNSINMGIDFSSDRGDKLSRFFAGAQIKKYNIDFTKMKCDHFNALEYFFASEFGMDLDMIIEDSIIDMNNLSFPNLTSMYMMFYYSEMKGNSEVRLKSWKMPKIQILSNIFDHVQWQDYKQLDISDWELSNTNHTYGEMSRLFEGANIPHADLDLSKWETGFAQRIVSNFSSAKLGALKVSGWNVENAEHIDSNFNSLQLTKPAEYDFDTKNVSTWRPKKISSMKYLFSKNKQVKKVDLSKWELPENRVNYFWAFFDMENLEELKFSRFEGNDDLGPYDVLNLLSAFSKNEYWVVKLDASGEHEGEVFGPYKQSSVDEKRDEYGNTTKKVFFTDKDSKAFDFEPNTLYKVFHYKADSTLPDTPPVKPSEPDPKPPVTSEPPVTPPSPPTPDPEPAEPPVEPKPEKPEVKPEVKPEPKPEVKPEPAPTPEPVPEPEPFTPPTLSESEPPIESLISSAGASEERETEVLPGMIPAQTSGATASDPSTAVDPGFIPTQTNVAGANLPKTGDGINASSTALLILLLGMSILLYGYVIRKRA